MAEKKRKLVTFNIFRPTLIEYKGRNILKTKRFDFNILLDYIKSQAKNFSILYQNEELAIYSIVKENLDEGLFHIRIIKYRKYDVPNAYTRLDTSNIDFNNDEETDFLLPDHDEDVIPLSDKSSIGETISILYDSYMNTFVVQSNTHCTTTRGIITLFDSIYNQFLNENPEEEHTEEESDFMFHLAVIPPKDLYEKIDNFDYITEIEFVYEDNDMQDDVAETLGVNNDVKAGKIQARYHLDTSKDKKKTLDRSYINNVLNLFRKKKTKFKKLDLKGRNNENSTIDLIELIGARLFFKHSFTYTVEKPYLDHESVYYEMEMKYLGREGNEGYRRKANY
ncbi:DUF6731 family protein [Mammaliicoccus sciuri]|uniref:DUF6731 family protein n=1 Tax=Mammaliicoccus sciuri TaxID=1296 RepID=UPI001FB4938D|nr:DUF6731 family protein [Mammaliicoccus sciuri]MCJ0918726.1 hypothetical protein [Mammaliicoccus sciuri]MCJ0961254.1 hypothetical protein [Mammaliicoccus sciuri]